MSADYNLSHLLSLIDLLFNEVVNDNDSIDETKTKKSKRAIGLNFHKYVKHILIQYYEAYICTNKVKAISKLVLRSKTYFDM